jgi:hypothetical protein
LQVSGEEHNRFATACDRLAPFRPKANLRLKPSVAKERKARAERRAAAAWEREHEHGDPEIHEGEILPKIQQLTEPQLMKALV